MLMKRLINYLQRGSLKGSALPGVNVYPYPLLLLSKPASKLPSGLLHRPIRCLDPL